MEDRIRKDVPRDLTLWIRERVAVIRSFRLVGVTFIPRMEMFAVETLRKHLCYFLTSVIRCVPSFSRIYEL